MFANLWTDTAPVVSLHAYTLCHDRRLAETLPRNAPGPNPRPRPRQYAMWIFSDHRISPAAAVCRVERSSDSLGPQKTIYRFLVCETDTCPRPECELRGVNETGSEQGIEAKRAAERRIPRQTKIQRTDGNVSFSSRRGEYGTEWWPKERGKKLGYIYMCVRTETRI